MIVKVNIKLINSDFDQDIARDFFDNEDADGNFRYLWEDEMIWKGNWDQFIIKHNQSYQLNVLVNNQAKEYFIPNTTLLQVIKNKAVAEQMVISKKLIKKIEKKNEATDVINVEVILKPTHRFLNPFTGAYFLESDFPTELLLNVNAADIYGG
jgi:hypothetical protein